MKSNLNYETYVFLSSKKIVISVYSNLNEKIYENKMFFEENTDVQKILPKLENFLSKEILKIEKKIQNFIEKVLVILDLKVFFCMKVSIKDINHNNFIKLKNLNYLLYEVKDHSKKTIGKRKICHMLIENYKLDNKDYPLLPTNVSGKNFSLDLKFICLSNDFIKILEKIFIKYQISIEQVVCKDYVSKFLDKNNEDIFLLTKKMLEGHNPNEILLSNKIIKKQGFFEKFFNFFS